jgi:hypothetical protein
LKKIPNKIINIKLSKIIIIIKQHHQYKLKINYIVFVSEAETGRIFYFPPRPEKSSPRFAPPRFLKVFLLTALTPKTETKRIFYSPLRFAPKKVFPASPRQKWSPPRFPAPFRSLVCILFLIIYKIIL